MTEQERVVWKRVQQFAVAMKEFFPLDSTQGFSASQLDWACRELLDTKRCCERDNDGDGNCDIHSAPGKFRHMSTDNRLYIEFKHPNSNSTVMCWRRGYTSKWHSLTFPLQLSLNEESRMTALLRIALEEE